MKYGMGTFRTEPNIVCYFERKDGAEVNMA